MKNRCWKSLGYTALTTILVFSFMMGCAKKNPNAYFDAYVNSVFWESIVEEKKKQGYKLMSVKDSKKWLDEHSIDQSVLECLEKFNTTDTGWLRRDGFLMIATDDFLITLDNNNNSRVFAPSLQKPPQVPTNTHNNNSRGYMSPGPSESRGQQPSWDEQRWESFVAKKEEQGYKFRTYAFPLKVPLIRGI